MANTGFAEKAHEAGNGRLHAGYRAITQAGDRDQWAVVDDRGSVVFRGDARVAAMIASRLTRPSR